MKRGIVLLICLLVWLSYIIGCAPRNGIEALPQNKTLAVAGFSQPQHEWELLAGYMPDEQNMVDQEVLNELTLILLDEMEQKGVKKYCGTACVQQCREVVLYKHSAGNLSGVKYWSLVGQCVPAGYLLLPQLIEWNQRVGGEWGVEEPAKVVFDLFLIDVQKEQLIKRFRFEQEQQSLSENLFNIKRFFKYGAKWIRAEVLAREGISEGLEEMGF